MLEFKLQIGAMLAVLYYIVLSIREGSIRRKQSCSRIYDALLMISPWAILLDGATAWTVNHLEIVPEVFNRSLHLLFFLSMESVVLCMMMYLADITVGLNSIKRKILAITPALASMVGIHMFIGQLYYVHGKTTNYSMGVSVIIGYSVIIIYFMAGLVLLISHRHMISKRKKISVYSFMVVILLLLSIQVFYPESLITSLLPPICVIVLYENFENPNEKELNIYNREMIRGFATLVENRDNSTGNHIYRTQEYVKILLGKMCKDNTYKRLLNIDYMNAIIKAAPMHDIGKIATPDYILQKEGKLTSEEYGIMKEHAATGGKIMEETFAKVDDNEFLQVARGVARHHHERWDGAGYPDGLKGEAIPLHARVMAIADVFDAISAKRCYREAMPIEQCFSIIEEGAGTQFDPKLVALFLAARDEVSAFCEQNK